MTEPIPGPYKVDPDDRPGMEWNNHIVVAADPNRRIAFMAHDGLRGTDEFEATAHLLAASWEMLAALKVASEIISSVRHLTLLNADDNTPIRETLKQIDAAIAQAEPPP